MDWTNSMQFFRLKEGPNKLQVENLETGDVLLRPKPRVLPPISSSPLLQEVASSSTSLLPADDNSTLRDNLVPGDRVRSGTFKPQSVLQPLGKNNLMGLEHAQPLKPLVHRPASKDAALHGSSSGVSMVPAPPIVAKATGENASKSKHVKARRCSKVISADPRPNSRPDDESINSAKNHGNGCQASKVIREKEVDSMLNTLDNLQEIMVVKKWIRQKSRLKEGLKKLQVENLRSGDVLLRPKPRVLPPISSSPQLQGVASLSTSLLPVGDNPALRDNLVPGDRVHSGIFKPRSVLQPLGKRNLTGLDHIHPLKPLVHRPASKDAGLHGSSSGVSMVPAPPTVAKATGENASKSKHVKARRCRKVISADPRPNSRPDDESINSAKNHGNGCQARKVMREKEVDSMLNTLDNLQEIIEVKKWIRQESRCVDERGLLTQKNIKSSNTTADRSSDHSAGAVGTNIKCKRTQSQQQQHSSMPELCRSTPSHTSGNHRQFGQFNNRLPYVRPNSSLSLSTLEEETEESDPSAAVTEDEEERKSEEEEEEEEEWEVRKSSMRSARRPSEKESESVGQQHIEQQVRKGAEQHQARRSTIVAYPEQTLQQALKLLSTQEWEKKVEGLTLIRRLCEQHTETLLPRLHELGLALTKEVKNLRSVVSRAAMLTLAHLYANLGRRMDAEVVGTARVLLQKAGEANNFIREDAERALSHMVLSVSPSSSVAALISTGLKHRCAAVRASAAHHLWMVSECEDPHRLLSMRKDLTERFIHAICSMTLDPAQEVRAYARKTLANLAIHPKLISLVEKCAPKNDYTAIKDIISKYQHSNVR